MSTVTSWFKKLVFCATRKRLTDSSVEVLATCCAKIYFRLKLQISCWWRASISHQERKRQNGQPVTAERERERAGGRGRAAAAVHPESLQEGSFSLILAGIGGSRDCRAASLQATAERERCRTIYRRLRMCRLQFLSRGSHLTSLSQKCILISIGGAMQGSAAAAAAECSTGIT
ncbi:hypothetical protein INR49_003690 [Caranx melampygus]|nr:hypothetical protein INR49_003690 [Caranx melampygus]